MAYRLLSVPVEASTGQKRLTTLEALKAELGITTTDEDSKLTEFIDQASQVITSFCGRPLAAEAVEETIFTDFWSTTLRLSRYPVISVASVSECGVPLTSGSDYIVDNAAGGLLRLDASGRIVSWGVGKIVATYTAGYALEAAAPRDLQRACISLAKMVRSAGLRDPYVKSEEVPGVNITEYWVGAIGNGALPDDVAGMLATYRRLPLGGS